MQINIKQLIPCIAGNCCDIIIIYGKEFHKIQKNQQKNKKMCVRVSVPPFINLHVILRNHENFTMEFVL